MLHLLSLLLVAGTMSQITTVTIPAEADATLIEDPGGAAANGQGPHFFVGRTSQGANALRRGLLRFDVAGHVPAGARIEAASLTLYVSQTNAGPANVSLRRVLFDWGEGPSSSTGGQGAPAQAGESSAASSLRAGWRRAASGLWSGLSARHQSLRAFEPVAGVGLDTRTLEPKGLEVL